MELELQVIMSFLIWELGAKLGLYATAAHAITTEPSLQYGKKICLRYFGKFPNFWKVSKDEQKEKIDYLLFLFLLS